MTDQPFDVAPDADVEGHRYTGTDAEMVDDIEGHGRFGEFVDADSAIDDPSPSRPSGAPGR